MSKKPIFLLSTIITFYCILTHIAIHKSRGFVWCWRNLAIILIYLTTCCSVIILTKVLKSLSKITSPKLWSINCARLLLFFIRVSTSKCSSGSLIVIRKFILLLKYIIATNSPLSLLILFRLSLVLYSTIINRWSSFLF
jgi:hypothetical protein